MIPTTCEKDGWPLELDIETARLSLRDEGRSVEIFRCRMGHSYRVDPPRLGDSPIVPDTNRRRVDVPCCYCGTVYSRNTGTRRYCGHACTKAAKKDRLACDRLGVRWVLEERPWYHGPDGLLDSKPKPEVDAYMLGAQRDWMEGFSRAYGV